MKKISFFLCCFLLLSTTITFAQSLSDKVKQTTEKKGFYTIYADEKAGKVYLLLDRLNEEFIYVNFLVTGLGSNDIGLDRGQIGGTRIVYFKRVGNKVLLIEPNQSYRAITTNQAEKKSVQEAFAQSVLAGFSIEAEEGNSLLIDVTSFLVQDVHGVANELKSANQGSYGMDASRSTVWFDVVKSFPDNTEMEALITLKGNATGSELRSVTPTSEFVSYRVRHSFVRLPDNQFQAVEYHPQAGYFNIDYQDYASPIPSSLTKRLITKHRLVKKNPGEAKSEAVKPIIYYVDSGAPEPVKTALIEGASWWNQAFEAAGFINAFQVAVLPADADPLDVRYNVIQWVHRSTRGWSYGSSVTDPRTGEIIKGHVSLGSLRVRQDYLIMTGLLSPFKKDIESEKDPMMEVALARLRQLSAHEVGHTIGIAHNFAASVSDRASVMDYPHPLITVSAKNQIEYKNAYAVGIGEWDKQVVKYGYADQGTESKNELYRLAVLKESSNKKLQFISDYDARISGGAHPDAHLWDNGNNPATELKRILGVRKLALANFTTSAIEKNTPSTSLEEALVPVYYFHRYQVEAAVKLVAGARYTYAVKGDSDSGVTPVSAKEQLEALQALIETLKPEHLALSETLLSQLSPRAPGYYNRRELFKTKTAPLFDPMAAAESHVEQTLDLLFNSARLERMVQQHARTNSLPGFADFISKPTFEAFSSLKSTSMNGELNRMVAGKWLENVIQVASNTYQSQGVRAQAHQLLLDLEADLMNRSAGKMVKALSDEQKTAYNWSLRLIKMYKENPTEVNLSKPISMPPGSPIGTSCEF